MGINLIIVSIICGLYTFINISVINKSIKKIKCMNEFDDEYYEKKKVKFYNKITAYYINKIGGKSVYFKTQEVYKYVLIMFPINHLLFFITFPFALANIGNQDVAFKISSFIFIVCLILQVVLMLKFKYKVNKTVSIDKTSIVYYSVLNSTIVALFFHPFIAVIVQKIA